MAETPSTPLEMQASLYQSEMKEKFLGSKLVTNLFVCDVTDVTRE